MILFKLIMENRKWMNTLAGIDTFIKPPATLQAAMVRGLVDPEKD